MVNSTLAWRETWRDRFVGGVRQRAEHWGVDAGFLGVILLCLPALLPLFRSGYFVSHDGMLHLYRLLGLDQAIVAGDLYPRWFPDFAFGYGHPILNFYGPFVYYVAELPHVVGAGWLASMKWAYAAGALAAGLGMYLFARRVFRGKQLPALVAAVAYCYAPYHLADLYVRGALAELWAMAWFPVILWALAGFADDAGRPPILALALAGAGLLVTHSLSALIIGSVVILYALLLLLTYRSRRVCLGLLGAAVLALALSAAYWLPAYAERGYVGLAEGQSAGYQEHLAPLGSFLLTSFTYRYFPNQTTTGAYPVSLLSLLLALPGLLAFWPRLGAPHGARLAGAALLAGVALGIGMMSTVSAPVWRVFEPALSFLQYPWRFHALASLGLAFFAGAGVWAVEAIGRRMIRRSRARLIGAGSSVVLIGLLMASALAALPFQSLDMGDQDVTLERMWAEERSAGQIGTTWTGEYVPVWVKEQRWAIGRSWLDADGPILSEANAGRAPDSLTFGDTVGCAGTLWCASVSSAQPATLLMHQFYYPGFVATIRDKAILARPFGSMGLAAFDLPAGDYVLQVRRRMTPAQIVGTIIGALGLCATVALAWMSGRRRSMALLLALSAVALGLLVGRAWDRNVPQWMRPQTVGAEMEGRAALVGFATDMPAARAGESAQIVLYWLARQGFRADLVTFAHLTSPDGMTLLAQSDQQPDGGFTPTTRWMAGELVPDRRRLTVPADLPAGRYPLFAGMYEPEPFRSLDITSDRKPATGGRVQIGYLEVIAR